MNSSKLRQKIAWVAARLLYSREESEYFQAKRKAARKVGGGWVRPSDLPSNSEIREEVRLLARVLESPAAHDERLLQMRLRAIWWMEQFQMFHPRLLGSVLTGHIREGSDIDLHLFTGNPSAIAQKVEDLGLESRLERKRLIKEETLRVFTHLHIADQFPVELTIYEPVYLGHRFRSSIDGRPIPTANRSELKRLVAMETGWDQQQLSQQLAEVETAADRWRIFEALLVPLEQVKQNPEYHPEGDALYHSLQVFQQARQIHAYDEDFLLAALLHDVGKAIDRQDHVAAGLQALTGFISERTAWLIKNHMLGHQLHAGSLGMRAKRRLTGHPWFEDLTDLSRCDRAGRCCGVAVPEVNEALEYIRNLESMFG